MFCWAKHHFSRGGEINKKKSGGVAASNGSEPQKNGGQKKKRQPIKGQGQGKPLKKEREPLVPRANRHNEIISSNGGKGRLTTDEKKDLVVAEDLTTLDETLGFRSVWGKDVAEWAASTGGITPTSTLCNGKGQVEEIKPSRPFKLFDFDLESRIHGSLQKLRDRIGSVDQDSLSGGTCETLLLSSSVCDEGSVSVSVVSTPVSRNGHTSNYLSEHDLQFFDHVFGGEEMGRLNLIEHDLPGFLNKDSLKDRNRMSPSGKQVAMDTATNTNGPVTRTNGHVGSLADLICDEGGEGDNKVIPKERIDTSTQVCIGSIFGNGRLIEEMTMSEDSEDGATTSIKNNHVRRNNNEHNQNQNAILLENTSLKEEINHMQLLIQELQGQVALLSSSVEQQKTLVGGQRLDLKESNSRFLAMSMVAQQCDLQRSLIAGRLASVESRCLLQENEKVEDTKRELASKLQEDRNSHKEQITALTTNYESEIGELEEYYEGRLARAKENNDVIMADLRKLHEEDMQRLEANYRAEIDLMKVRHEEHMAEQVKKTPGDILHKEIHSLQVVIEIRNQEIKDLRHDLLESQSKIEALTQTNEQNKALSAKVEDLEAQLEKTRRDKSKIMEKFNTMETSMTQVVTENDRLHLYTEELNWRIETLKSDDVAQSMSKSAIEFGTSFSSD